MGARFSLFRRSRKPRRGLEYEFMPLLASKRVSRPISAVLAPLFALTPYVGFLSLISRPAAVAAAPAVQLPLTDRHMRSASSHEKTVRGESTRVLSEQIEVVNEDDGTKTAVVHSGRVFFKDTAGDYRRIDNTLVEKSPGVFTNKANDVGLTISATGSTKKDPAAETPSVRVEAGGKQVGFSLPEVATKVEGSDGDLSIAGEKATYRYEAIPDGVKESIVLASPSANTTFAFPFDTGGMTPHMNDEGGITLADSGGVDRFRVLPPFMEDTQPTPFAAPPKRSDDVSYSIRSEGAATFLDVKIGRAFLDDPSTRYPVVVDPTLVTIYPEPTYDVTWGDWSSNNSINNTTTISAGYDAGQGYLARGYLRFDTDALMALNVSVNYAGLALYPGGSVISDGSPMQLAQVTADGAKQWDESDDGLTYDAQFAPPFNLTADLTYADVKPIHNWEWVTFDATGIVRDWMRKGVENGFVLKAPVEGSGDTWASFVASDLADSDDPVLTVNYSEYQGEESHWSTQPVSLANGHKGSVNVANGNLYVGRTDLEVADRSTGLSFGRSYNSKEASPDALVPMGNGWQANQSWIKDWGSRVEYHDEDGTSHFFVSDDGRYQAPPQLDQLNLRKVTSGGMAWAIDFPDYTTSTYDSDGRQRYVSDRYLNTVTRDYDAQGRLSKITSPTNRSLELSYSNGLLERVTEDAISGRYVKYQYTSGRLTGASNPVTQDSDLVYSTYDYDISGMLDSVKAPGVTADASFTLSSGSVVNWKDASLFGGAGQYSLALTSDAGVGQQAASVTDPAGRTTEYTFEKPGLATSITEPSGAVATIVNDDKFRPTVTKALSSTGGDVLSSSRTDYNSTGDVSSQSVSTDASTTATDTMGYADPNAPHDPSSETDASGATSTSGYTPEGDVAESTSPLGETDTSEYDAYGHVIKSRTLSKPDDSFVFNAGFEAGDIETPNKASGWHAYPIGTYGNYTRVSGGAQGSWAARIIGGGTSSSKGIWQKVLGMAALTGDAYVASAWVKVPAYTSGTFHPLKAAVYYTDTPTSNPSVHEATAMRSATTEWQRISLPFTTSATRDISHVMLYSYADASDGFVGTALVDGVQLDRGSSLRTYNLLSNGGLDRSEDGGSSDAWQPHAWSGATVTKPSGGAFGPLFGRLTCPSPCSNGLSELVAVSSNMLETNQASVETDTTGFSNYVGGSTIARDTGQHVHGAANLQTTISNAAPWQGFQTTKIKAEPNTQYTASAYLKSYNSPGEPLYIWVMEYTSADVFVGETSYGPFTPSSSAWTRYSVTRTTSSNAAKITLKVTGNGTTGEGQKTFWADKMQLEKGGVATEMNMPVAPKNLLWDNQASVEDGTTGLIPYGAVTTSRDTTYSQSGSSSFKVVTSGSSAYQGFRPWTRVTAPGSHTYTGSVYLRGQTDVRGTVTLYLLEYAADGTTLVDYTTKQITLTDSFVRHSVSNTFGSTGAQVELRVTTPTAQAITFWADNMQIEHGASATEWQLPSGGANQQIGLKPSTWYTFSMWAKGTGWPSTAQDVASLVESDGTAHAIQMKGSSTVWRNLSTSFKTGSTTTGVSTLYAKLPMAGVTLDFDGMKVEEGRRESTSVWDWTSNYRNKASDMDHLGQTTSYTHDARGNLTRTVAPDGTSTSAAYDHRDLVTSQTDELGNSRYFAYDSSGNRTAARSARSSGPSDDTYKISYEYLDGTSVLSRVTDPLGRAATFSYDELGNKTQIARASGATIDTSYDHHGRATTVSYNAIPTYGFAYDAAGRRNAVTDGSGTTLEATTYGMASQILSRTDWNVPTSAYTTNVSYDASGSTTAIGYSGATVDYLYDAGGRLTSLGRGGTTLGLFAYAEGGAAARTERPGAFIDQTSYDLGGRISSIAHMAIAGTAIAEDSYAYDTAGNIISYAAKEGTHTYDYDDKGRLTQWSDAASGDETRYYYNADDDLTSVAVSADASGYKTVQAFSHDAADQATSYTDSRSGVTADHELVYDDDGNLISDDAATYGWDAGGRLTRYVSDGVTTDYTYNDGGYRTSKTTGAVTTYYHWSRHQMIAETDENGETLASYTYRPEDYTPFSMARGGVTYHYTKNARGDVTAITTSTGDVLARYTYDPWGKPLTVINGAGQDISADSSHIANKNPWRYAGYYWDPESQLYYLQARYYRPDIYRFISIDPLPDQSLYSYAQNNPVLRGDPDGRCPCMLNEQYNTVRYGRGAGWSGVVLGAVLGGVGVAAVRNTMMAITRRTGMSYYRRNKQASQVASGVVGTLGIAGAMWQWITPPQNGDKVIFRIRTWCTGDVWARISYWTFYGDLKWRKYRKWA